jgi:thermitase
MLYVIGFTGIIISLTAWLLLRRLHRYVAIAPGILITALLTYLVGLMGLDQYFQDKLGVFARDMLIFALSGMATLYLERHRKLLPAGLLLMLALLAWFVQGSLKPKGLEASGELFIRLAEGQSTAALDKLIRQYDLQLRLAFSPADTAITRLDDYYLVDIPDRFAGSLPRIRRSLQRTGLLDAMEDNETVQISPLSGNMDAGPGELYGLNDPGLTQLWGFEAMQMDQFYAWLRSSGTAPKKTALVVILDTGVDAGHEDLADNYRSIARKHDTDPMGHGTHCAGIAGAVGNNGRGIASFTIDTPYYMVSSIKVLNAGGSGSQQSIVAGMLSAADAGADVISMSLGGRTGSVRQRAYEEAVAYASAKGAIVVAAAGNANRNARDFSPVNTRGVIGVSAVDPALNRASFSNYVTELGMGLAAPGVNIYSTIPGNQYAAYNGTSMATPYVAGLLGMMKSLRPELKAEQAYAILKQTGIDTRNTAETGRLIQPAAALKLLMIGNR